MFLPRWAVVQHPLVQGDLVIVAPQTPKAGVVFFDQLTGALKWKIDPPAVPGYFLYYASRRQQPRALVETLRV